MRYRINQDGRRRLKKSGVTLRQLDVINEMINVPKRSIACARLKITDRTLKFHLTRIYKNCEVKNFQELLVNLFRFFEPDYSSDLPKSRFVQVARED